MSNFGNGPQRPDTTPGVQGGLRGAGKPELSSVLIDAVSLFVSPSGGFLPGLLLGIILERKVTLFTTGSKHTGLAGGYRGWRGRHPFWETRGSPRGAFIPNHLISVQIPLVGNTVILKECKEAKREKKKKNPL